jgi:1-acyl-sn-glycerol-3-phosphate acyltransferase
MPLPPLPDPESPSARLRGLSVGVPVASTLFGSLLAINAGQTLSLAVRPFSRHAFRRINRFAADTWWGWCVLASRHIHAIDVVVTGDPIPDRENAIVIANHQQMADITFLFFLARQKERLGDLKWIVKDVFKYVPAVGWGMLFLDCVFVKRDWTRDRASIDRTFSHLVRDAVPMWLISFPEGTRLTPDKLAASREYAAEHGLAPLEHLLVPRSKGFVASVTGLRSHVTAVYDVTIGYEGGVPTLWQYVKGYAKRAHLHVRRWPVAELPTDEDAVGAWLQARYQEKDRLLDDFYRTGSFPAT